jgi:hypothetical protein
MALQSATTYAFDYKFVVGSNVLFVIRFIGKGKIAS